MTRFTEGLFVCVVMVALAALGALGCSSEPTPTPKDKLADPIKKPVDLKEFP